MKKKEIIENQAQNLIKHIFSSDTSPERLLNDMEIEENELNDIHHNLAKAWYIDGLNIPTEYKKKLLQVQLRDVKTYCFYIIKKIDSALKSKKFNVK